ncbi:MAG TPA: hypothetical protein VFE72_12590 [Lysobacter sp.]|nr:hypothetical protein [Lysobacter sp.]
MSVLTLALGLGLTLPASPDVQAAYTGIQRCRAPDGTAVYTDKPCAAFGATPEATSAELGMRLASEALREPAAFDDAVRDDTVAIAGAAPGRRSLLGGCARTPTQLAMDIQGAVALHDVNRLAESWYWVGMTQKQATPVMSRLEGIARGDVVSTQYYDAQIGFGLQLASADGASADGRAGILQVAVAGRRAQSLELNVERYAGCYFARF